MSIDLKSAGLDKQQKITTMASKNPSFCRDSDTIKQVVEKIVSTGHRRIPVVSRGGDIVGVITKSDILDAYLRKEDFDNKISEIMSREPITCSQNESVGYVLQKFKLSRRGGFPVTDGKKLVGMVSERDFVKQLLGSKTGVKVSDVMTKKPLFIQPDISVYDCLKTMVNTHYRRLPVVSGGKIVGLVTSEDMLRYVHNHNYMSEDLDEPLDKVMIKDVFTVQPDDDLSLAIKIMETKDIGGVLVASEDGELDGIITERDILERMQLD